MLVIIGEKSRASAAANQNLCLTCRYYRRVRYGLDDREERTCNHTGNSWFPLRGPVSECTDYIDKSRPYMHDMEKIAWTIETSKRTVGFNPEIKFVPPKKRDEDL